MDGGGEAGRYVERILAELEGGTLVLPTLPEVALRVRDEVEAPDADAASVAAAVAEDSALSARLLQVANSAAFRGTQPVETLQLAVARLGLRVVRDLITGFAMQQILQPTREAVDRALRTLWRHSTETAAACAALAQILPGFRADEALLAGLVHDIGKLPVLAVAETDDALGADAALLDRVARQLHPRLGRVILESWGLPPFAVEVAGEHADLHRDAEQGDYVDLVQVVHLQAARGTDAPWSDVDWSTVGAFSRLGLAPDQEAVCIEMDETMLEALAL